MIHDKDSKSYVEKLKLASEQVGIPTFLATSTTIPETLLTLEKTVVAPI